MRLHLIHNVEWNDWEVCSERGYQFFAADNYSEAADFMQMANSAMDLVLLKVAQEHEREFTNWNPIGIMNIEGVKPIDPNVRRDGPEPDST